MLPLEGLVKFLMFSSFEWFLLIKPNTTTWIDVGYQGLLKE